MPNFAMCLTACDQAGEEVEENSVIICLEIKCEEFYRGIACLGHEYTVSIGGSHTGSYRMLTRLRTVNTR